MTNSEAIVLSSSDGYQPLVVRASAGESSASALAARRTSFESLALSGFGLVATFAAMRCSTPAESLVASPSADLVQSGAGLSLSAARRRSTPSVRASVRFASVFLPAPQPYRTALPSAQQFGLPLAAARSADRASTRRFAAARQRWRKCNESPNHALQRTAPAVTAPASGLRLSPATQVPRQPPRSLSLGSLGDLPHVS